MDRAVLKQVHPSQTLLDDLSKYNVVDVREPHERVEIGFVPESVNIPLAQVLDGSASVPEGKPLLLVCRSGGRSRRAGECLLDRKFQDVTNLEGGTVGWIEQGLPVERVKE